MVHISAKLAFAALLAAPALAQPIALDAQEEYTREFDDSEIADVFARAGLGALVKKVGRYAFKAIGVGATVAPLVMEKREFAEEFEAAFARELEAELDAHRKRPSHLTHPRRARSGAPHWTPEVEGADELDARPSHHRGGPPSHGTGSAVRAPQGGHRHKRREFLELEDLD